MESNKRLIRLCVEKMQNHGLYNQKYCDRLKLEMGEVNIQGDHDYFLELYDKRAKYAQNQNNMLIPWLLGIVDDFDIKAEPKYVWGDFPDVDIDYLKEVRDWLKDVWAPNRFGRECVCSIGNYTTFGIKSALIDMARIHGQDHQEILKISTQLEDRDEDNKPVTWEKALEQNPLLKEYCEKHPDIAKASQKMLNRSRGRGKHAGGLIISKSSIDSTVPLIIDKQGNPVSAWSEGLHAQDLGIVGYVKYDLLVVTNLVQIAIATQMVKDRHHLDKICAKPGQEDWTDDSYLEDPECLKMANDGRLKAIFQFDSPGIRDLVKKGGVTRFEDMVAYSSLFRPASLNSGMAAAYVNRKRGKEEYSLHPLLEPILGNTYGVMCIHEDALISKSSGSEVPIKNIEIFDDVHSLNICTKKIEAKQCHGCGPTVKQDGLKITLENGFSIILTPDHKVLTYSGYKEAQDLNENDLVAVAYNTPQFISFRQPIASWLGEDTDVAYLLGQLVGDGCLTGCGITIASGTKINHTKLLNWIKSHFSKIKCHEYFNIRSYYIGLSCSELLNDSTYGNRKTRFHKFIEDCGLKTKSKYKKIPAFIFNLDSVVRRAFLAGLIDSDGMLYCCDKSLVCSITSASNDLLQGIRKLCELEGLICSIIDGLHVYIWDTKKLKRILSKYLVVKSFSGKLHDGQCVGWLPKSCLLTLSSKFDSIRSFCKTYGISRKNYYLKHDFIRTRTALKVGINLGDLRYYKVRSKDKVYNQQFYSMSVADNHNLIANGIVVSNCYQEQVMRVLNVIGNIPLSHCEIVRKAISKKKLELFKKYKDQFVSNGQKNLGWGKEQVEEMWGQIENWAGYGFNRSHAVSYSVISAQLLYLKTHYPLEFFAAILSCENDEEKIKEYRLEAEECDVEINTLDINKSKVTFEIVDNKIYYGFSHVKGIGKEVAKKIINGQPYNGFLDFMQRFGTDASVMKPLIGLGLFNESDRVNLWCFCEYFKEQTRRKIDRDKRAQIVLAAKVEELKQLYNEPFTGKEAFENEVIKIKKAYKKENADKKSLIEKLERLHQNREMFAGKDEFEKAVTKIKKGYRSSKANWEKKKFEDKSVTFEDFLAENHHPNEFIKDEWRELYEDDLAAAQNRFYGFRWDRILNKSPDYTGKTFEELDLLAETQDIYCRAVEIQVISKPYQVTSKKGTVYYNLKCEDGNGRQELITVWKDDFLRFKEEFSYWESDSRLGNLLSIKIQRPSGEYKKYKYKKYSFQSWGRQYKHLAPKIKDEDGRLIVMRRPRS